MAQKIEWTTDRPTEPGEYWVSIEPGKRKGRIAFPGVIPCEVSLCANAYLMNIGSLDIGSEANGLTLAARYITGGAWVPLKDEWYDGAKWSRDLVPNRKNTSFLWVVAGGLGDEDTAEKLKALKESVARWAETVPKDVAEDLFGDAK